MEKDDLHIRVRKFLANIPDTDMSPASRQLLHESPLDWMASKRRSLRAALLSGDMEAVESLKIDMANVIGLEKASWWVLDTLERLAFDGMDPEDYDPDTE